MNLESMMIRSLQLFYLLFFLLCDFSLFFLKAHKSKGTWPKKNKSFLYIYSVKPSTQIELERSIHLGKAPQLALLD